VRHHTPRLHDPRPRPRGQRRHRWHPALRRRWHRAPHHRKSQGRKSQDRKPRKCRHRTSRARRRRTGRGQILRPRNATRRLRWSTATFNNSSGMFSKSATSSDNSCVQNASVSSRRPRRQSKMRRARKPRQTCRTRKPGPICRRSGSNSSIHGNSCGLNAPCSVVKTASCGVFRQRRKPSGGTRFGMPVSSAH